VRIRVIRGNKPFGSGLSRLGDAKNVKGSAGDRILTTTMPMMRTTIEALEQAGLRVRVKAMVGGTPVTQT